MTVAAVRAELVTKLKTVDPISGRSYGYAPDSVEPPTGFVGAISFDPRAAFGGVPDLTAQVWVTTGTAASAGRAVDALDKYVDGTHDVIAALEGAATAWGSLAVTNVELPVTLTIGASEYLAARFDCEVYL